MEREEPKDESRPLRLLGLPACLPAGSAKPEPAAYAWRIRELGLPPEEILSSRT
ncbi:hypothetical protein [Streptomyces sp. CG 926]|uniref:hypothetical protein n=1 Tax=Streptomyces sp. CG 926 TaxID=1882405 RepID=UPI0015E80B2D|nr:hypothetical protein [Streptomyces sp. CG 926]